MKIVWTEREDNLLRKYGSRQDGYNLIRKSLKRMKLAERTNHAIRARMRRLGLSRPSRRWTQTENKILALEWSECTMRTLRSKLPNRTASAICQHARKMELDGPVPRDWLSLGKASDKSGYSRNEIRQMMTAAEKSFRASKTPRKPGVKARPYVAYDDLIEAIALWERSESVYLARLRLGISWEQLVENLSEMGYERPVAREGEKLATWRMDSEILERAATLHEQSEADVSIFDLQLASAPNVAETDAA